MASNQPGKLIVVGASNMDLIAYVPRFPTPGETLKGNKFQTGFGGKGANQAVAAAALGGEVMMVTKVGNDAFGKTTMENFKSRGVGTKYVFQSETTATGCAPILVEDSGENSIVIVGGANDEMTEEELNSIVEDIQPLPSHAVLCQMEIPLEHTKKALLLASQKGARTILNTAPATRLDKTVLTACSMVIANETEFHQILGLPIPSSSPSSPFSYLGNYQMYLETSKQLFLDSREGSHPLEAVLITLGSRGCFLVTTPELLKGSLKEGETKLETKLGEDLLHGVHLPAPKVGKVVDTTGAGDCFVGTFAHFVCGGKTFLEAARAAGVMASLSVQKEGTQSSYSSALPKDFSF